MSFKLRFLIASIACEALTTAKSVAGNTVVGEADVLVLPIALVLTRISWLKMHFPYSKHRQPPIGL